MLLKQRTAIKTETSRSALGDKDAADSCQMLSDRRGAVRDRRQSASDRRQAPMERRRGNAPQALVERAGGNCRRQLSSAIAAGAQAVNPQGRVGNNAGVGRGARKPAYNRPNKRRSMQKKAQRAYLSRWTHKQHAVLITKSAQNEGKKDNGYSKWLKRYSQCLARYSRRVSRSTRRPVRSRQLLKHYSQWLARYSRCLNRSSQQLSPCSQRSSRYSQQLTRYSQQLARSSRRLARSSQQSGRLSRQPARSRRRPGRSRS